MKDCFLSCMLLLLIYQVQSDVSLYNLKVFFESTYDRNQDGFADLFEMVSYFQVL
jgi:hypothetical protein